MYFARAGYTWARLILSGLSAYVLVGGVMAFAGERVWTQAPQIVARVCAAAALLLLMRRDADTYCREMAQFGPTPNTGRVGAGLPDYAVAGIFAAARA